MSVEFSPEAQERAKEILNRYPAEHKKAAVVPLLHLAQKEWGYVSSDAMVCVAGLIGCSPVKVAEIATFYPMFRKEPAGKHRVIVCHTLPCALAGCGDIYQYLSQKLGIGLGETTADKNITLEKSECPGVSIMLILVSFHFIEAGFARIVIPRSFSRSPLSITLSSTCWLSRHNPLCFIIESIKVVFPWST